MTAEPDEAILRRLDELIEAGDALAGRQGSGFYAELAGWRARASAAIVSIVGKDHAYAASFEADAPSGYERSVGNGVAILRALRADVEAGYLRTQADLVAASVFSDFLDMAGHLLEGGYVHAAASLIGAVVEDGLRRIAAASGVAVGPRDDINALSSKLRQAGVFNPLVAKRVTLWAEIRNYADHGDFDKVVAADVEEMYKAATAFMAERLG